jgi:hypothetical protein
VSVDPSLGWDSLAEARDGDAAALIIEAPTMVRTFETIGFRPADRERDVSVRTPIEERDRATVRQARDRQGRTEELEGPGLFTHVRRTRDGVPGLGDRLDGPRRAEPARFNLVHALVAPMPHGRACGGVRT